MSIPDSFFQFSNTINGEARSGSKITQAINPSNKQPLWDVPVASEDDLNEAVAAAAAAFPGWSQTPWSERGKLLLQASEVLKANLKEMASLGMQETGKPVCPQSFLECVDRCGRVSALCLLSK